MPKILRSRRSLPGLAVIVIITLAAAAAWYRVGPVAGNVLTSAAIDAPAPLATWPWPHALREPIHPGVTHWLDRSSPDGTVLDLFEFDFHLHPGLEFLLFDQDQDDDHPFDNKALYWNRGVATITKQLNSEGKGAIVAATNGLFFGYTKRGPDGVASHVAPVVLDGKPHYAGGAHPRWTFAVAPGDHSPLFTQRDGAVGERLDQYTFACGGAESLVREGKLALTLGTVNKSVDFDMMRTTRVGLGWTRASEKLYLLFVSEPDSESLSALAARNGVSLAGGWSVPDVARFFVALGVWEAINSDAGAVGQLIYRTPDARYQLVPPKWASREARMTLDADFANAPQGGTLMYWVVRDRSMRDERPGDESAHP